MLSGFSPCPGEGILRFSIGQLRHNFEVWTVRKSKGRRMQSRRELLNASLNTSLLPGLRLEEAEVDVLSTFGGSHDDRFDACARACSACQRACDACATWCARSVARGMHRYQAVLTACRDCADLCFAAAQICTRNGMALDLICLASADACRRCAELCEQYAAADKCLQQCARKCRESEKTCRSVLPVAVSRGRK